jgi:hypothetical protein
VLPHIVRWLAVLEYVSAVLIDAPDHALRLTALHGSVELGLFVWQAKAEDDVGHVLGSRMWNAAQLGLPTGRRRALDKVGQGDWQTVSAVMPPRQRFRGQQPNRTAGKRQPAVCYRLS